MRRRLLLATCIALPVSAGVVALGALAQAEGERQFDAAVARLRAGLGPDGAVAWRARRIDPVTGTATLDGLELRDAGGGRLLAGQAVLEGLRADGAGRATLTDLRIERTGGGEAGRAALTAGRVVLAGVALPPTGGGAAVDWANAAAEEATAEGVRVTEPGRGEAELGRLTLRGYAPGRVAEAVAEGLRFEDRSNGTTRIRLGRARLAGAVVPRVGQPFDPWALAADSAALEGVEVTATTPDGSLRLGRAGLENWGEGRIGSFTAEGVAIGGTGADVGAVSAEIGSARMTGVAARDTAKAWAEGVAPPGNAPGREQLMRLEGVAVSAGGARVVRVGAMNLRNAWDPAEAGTEVGTLAVEGVAIDLPPDWGGSWLDGLGFKGIAAGIEVAARMQREAGRMTTDPFTIRAAGMGTLGFTMDMRGIAVPRPGEPSASGDDPLAVVAGWTIAGMTVRYTEEGLLRAVLAQQARQQRVPERQLRESYAAMALQAPLPTGAGGKEPPAIRPAREAVASFLRDLGSIEVAIRPPAPVPMMTLMTLGSTPPEDAIRELGISVTSAPPRR